MGFPGDSVVKSLPAMQEMQETHILSLDQEDPLDKDMKTSSIILVDNEGGWATVHGIAKSDTTEWLSMNMQKL